jgi:ferredoxin
MLQLALDKKDLKKLIAAMLKEGVVRAPVKTGQGAAFADIGEKSDVSLDYTNVKLPLKREFFPQCEVISSFGLDGVNTETLGNKKVVLFGVRPCDAQAIAFLDKVFIDEKYADPYYHSKRNNTLIIAHACAEPANTCFCASLGAGPAGKIGSDALTYTIGAALVFESVSEKGEAFLKKNKKIFREVLPKELQALKKQESEAIKKQLALDISKVTEALGKKNDPLFWNLIAETCLSCGACTFLCPTCHCFDLFDEKNREGGRRIRVHDACLFEQFTREASGHNPRVNKGDRMRQRIMHKFSYAPENFNTIFCVGCGRCIANCPSNIDIRETLSKVTA